MLLFVGSRNGATSGTSGELASNLTFLTVVPREIRTSTSSSESRNPSRISSVRPNASRKNSAERVGDGVVVGENVTALGEGIDGVLVWSTGFEEGTGAKVLGIELGMGDVTSVLLGYSGGPADSNSFDGDNVTPVGAELGSGLVVGLAAVSKTGTSVGFLDGPANSDSFDGDNVTSVGAKLGSGPGVVGLAVASEPGFLVGFPDGFGVGLGLKVSEG